MCKVRYHNCIGSVIVSTIAYITGVETENGTKVNVQLLLYSTKRYRNIHLPSEIKQNRNQWFCQKG